MLVTGLVGTGRSSRCALVGVIPAMALALFLIAAAPALASTADDIQALPVLDPLNDRSEQPLSNEGKWSALSWSGGNETGRTTTSGWGPYDAFSTVNGAYWSPSTSSDANGNAAAATMQTAPGIAQRYVALWLNMADPGSSKSGYQLRWESISGSSYRLTLSKWSGGTETVLAEEASTEIPLGSTLAISDTGDTVTAWQGSGGSLSSLIEAEDSTFDEGYAGIEGSGNISRSVDFKAGALSGPPPDTTVDSGPEGTVSPGGAVFTFSASGGATAFECTLDGEPFSSCVSPKDYSANIAVGPHNFEVRAVGAGGNDPTPAQRNFHVAKVPNATTGQAQSVSAITALLTGDVNPEGAEAEYRFEYGKTTSYGSTVPVQSKSIAAGTVAVPVEEEIDNLEEGTIYHYRLVAENAIGTTEGVDETFTTGELPEATTEAPKAVESNEAILTGEVETNGADTSYKFEYGETAAYGEETAGGWEEIGSGAGEAEVEEALAFLEPETTYHYRVAAINDGGIEAGKDKTFTTAQATVTPQQEAEEQAEEVAFTSKFAYLPDEFINMMWSGHDPRTAEPHHLEKIRRSGAKMLRLAVGPNPGGVIEWEKYDQIFDLAAKRGIMILPIMGGGYFPSSTEDLEHWDQDVTEIMQRYGPKGWFWSGKAYARPAVYWEFWNEENYAVNGGLNGSRSPENFGKLLEHTSDVMESAADGGWFSIILGGLLSVSAPTDSERDGRRTPAEFLEQMGPYGKDDYDAVGLHPYAFKTNSGGAPIGSNGVTQVRNKVRANIKTTRDALNAIGGENKELWLTELGWPVENLWDNSHKPVSLLVQRELIEATFEMLKAINIKFGIRNVFYYNIQDTHCYPGELAPGQSCHPFNINVDDWAYRSGLLGDLGGRPDWPNGGKPTFRPGWYGFLNETGKPEWPVKPKAKTKNAKKKASHHARLSAEINPFGAPTSVRFKYGETTAYGTSTGWLSAGFEEGDAEVEKEITGLTQGKTYHYNVIAVNDNGEKEEGEDMQFTAEPNTTPYITQPVESFNGNPGYVTVRGGVSSSEETIYGKYVNINFSKWENNEWVYKNTYEPHPVVDGGVYEARFWPVGKGKWRVKTVFPAQGSLDASESGYHEFEIKDGYQFVNTNSGKCLDIAWASPDNGAQAIQYECHSPPANNQIFSLSPVNTGSHSDFFHIVARNSGKCVDVRNDNQVAGEQLQQWACVTNPSVSVQEWRRFGGSNGWNFEIQHSGQCMDVWESGTGNGHKIDQWPCNGTNAQGWQLVSVEGSPVSTQTSIESPEVHNGEPGWVNVGGDLDVAGYPLSGKWVNVNFQKNEGGTWVTKETKHLSAENAGHFAVSDVWLGVGSWRVRAVYQGEGSLAESVSSYEYFTMGRGYRLVNQTSGKCLSISEGSGGNGAKAIQWDCSGNPQPGDGQLFTWFPVVGQWPYFQIRFNEPGGNNAGKCLDVTGVSQSDGVQLQLWECLGAGQANQLWKGEGGGSYLEFKAKHSGKCIDDWLSGTGNGNKIDQYSCNGTGAQKWKFQNIGP